MAIDHTESAAPATPAKNQELADRLSSAGWALFFIWIGIAVLVHLSWAWSLIGVGAIILGEQAARWRLDMKVRPRSVVLGAIFLVGGLWQLFYFSFPLAPLLLIAVGATILWNGFFGKGTG